MRDDSARAPSEAERLRFILSLIAIAVATATVLVYGIHEYYRPDLQAYLTQLAFAVSLAVATPICVIVGGMHYDLRMTKVDLEIAKRAVEAANAAKSDFLANMSHEIRTPMNGVLGMAEVLAMTPLDEKQSACVATINRSGAALLGIINDILDLSKIEAGKLELDIAAFDLREIVDDIVALLAPGAAQKGVRLYADFPEDAPREFEGDALRIRQIVTNLAGNAVKFTNQGEVAIIVRTEISDRMADIRIGVKDTGIGIPPDKIASIFEKFTQAESSTTRKYGGTGLGLAISKRLADRMGAALDVKSEPGKGSVFTFTLNLPLAARAAAKETGPLPTAERSDGARTRLLVAEDNEVNQLVLKSMIGADYDLVFAKNGREAISAFMAGKFAAVLMDVFMPVMDGYAATAAIRKIEAETGAARTPIICLTADTQSGGREEILSRGMDDLVTKPLRRVELLARLAAWTAPGAKSAAA